jgi:DNA-binding HxlR family transcriptional regulator
VAKRAKSNKMLDAAAMCEALHPEKEAVIRDVRSRVTDKWSLWTLSELTADGPLRFSRLLERVEGVSQKSLTATLRGLERDGLIRRTVTVQVPIRVDYEAAPWGHKLIANFQPFWAWAVGRVAYFTAARAKFDGRDQEYKSEQKQH